MASTNSVNFDEDQYRREVLSLSSEEEEIAQQQRLAEEAKELGLKVPEVEIVASLAASIASGLVDFSSPILSSSSSTGRNSMYEPAHDSPALEQLATSLSEYTISSNPPARGGSTRSTASLSTRPTSYSSSEGRLAQGTDGTAMRSSGNNGSLLSVISGSDKKKERRRSGIKSAIDKIPFRKRRRTPSTVLLPPAAHVTFTKSEGGVEKLYVESKPDEARLSISPENKEEPLKLEVPVFDNEALLRSLANSELKQLRESQTSERNLHVSFQTNLINGLRRSQQPKVEEKLAQNRQLENEKREKNVADAARMEERQLVVEMEQVREFERAKANSRTRIKYMEGYLSSSSPPDSRSPSLSGSDLTTPSRSFTQQHKAQLAQEYHDYESMSQLHAAKIKVLRDRQEIRLQEAIARMDRELDCMTKKHAAELSELQKEHQQEEATILQALNAKKTKLRQKWVLEEAILRKKLEIQDGKPYGPLPPLSFSDSQSETRDSAICVSDPDGETETDASSQRKKEP
ncbi:hypothetical protein AN4834.2 [Aspergillus nidulans FGSC A4]|uniref:Uncharacterized protein n=1 Tax=Emericella nidulans (strain FGSC A4 / ATCC 38163 / CBS 112.46 / NRRL 194 / M139) TaxID=227321 RepID=Q5B3P6_EMENI|nr:hypothetical protein [Aspergillus nidulans FGSC A4]EAA60069.1 hypothetical protein AN4834.2 [Aspergillus nidulans FGSC A4]CBF76670.1 TPA: conserved hypothetical protein [Aspergillus nidulans FGSC A4]|eukprot:XP_662438.1 hypothetical protein AN4834.2 [Aspergillus nidulans FGSC A4]